MGVLADAHMEIAVGLDSGGKKRRRFSVDEAVAEASLCVARNFSLTFLGASAAMVVGSFVYAEDDHLGSSSRVIKKRNEIDPRKFVLNKYEDIRS